VYTKVVEIGYRAPICPFVSFPIFEYSLTIRCRHYGPLLLNFPVYLLLHREIYHIQDNHQIQMLIMIQIFSDVLHIFLVF
jgi:hypothetical protein